MQISAHMNTRMNQRGIRKCLVDLALDLGDISGDRYVLSPKVIDQEISLLQQRVKLLDEARKKGGIVVVAEGKTAVTTYRLSSFQRAKAKNKNSMIMGLA